jgi:GWxTD domain-containing protein
MKATRLAAVLLLLPFLSAPPCLGAGLERYKGWNETPEFTFLATEAEQKAWKKIATDEEADHFIQLFWAKRDPDLKTAVNEFKVVFDQRVKWADENFGMVRRRGALTERGKLYILLGEPTLLQRVAGTKLQPGFATGSQEDVNSGTAPGKLRPANDPGTSIGESIVTFKYDADKLPAWSPVKSLTAKFVVEALRDYVGDSSAGTVNSLEVKARTAWLVNPGLKEPPHFRTAAELEAETKAAAAAAAEALKGPALTPAARAALEAVAEDTVLLSVLPLTGGETDDTRIQAQIFLPASAGEPPADGRLAFLVRDKDGKDAARLEEATSLEPVAGGRFASRWFSVPPGDYTVAAGVFDASGKTLAAAKRAVTVAPAPADFAISPIIVAGAFFPVPSPKPGDSFTFSGYRFVAKGGRLDPQDALAFVLRVYNPAIDPATKTVSVSRTVKLKPKGSPPVDIPQPQDPPVKVPDAKDRDAKGIVTLDVSAVLIETRLGEFLRRAGEYEIKVVVTDNVSKKTAEGSATFVVTGTLPPKTGTAPPKK